MVTGRKCLSGHGKIAMVTGSKSLSGQGKLVMVNGDRQGKLAWQANLSAQGKILMVIYGDISFLQ